VILTQQAVEVNKIIEQIIQRYGDIMPDLMRFQQVMQRPLAKTGWINPLKTELTVVRDLLAPSANLVPGAVWSSAYRYEGDVEAAQVPVKLGYWHWQEEVSMLPPLLLNPQPGERVLDLCAAPGNKTTQCAVLMNNQGVLVANDINYHRIKALGKNLKRLGVVNACLTQYNGLRLPPATDFFDKVMVDAPCSCEGTARKNRHIQVNPQLSQQKAQLQIQLLDKALTLCKPGGQVIYSTCTFAPEENEGVIQAVLDKFAGEVQLLPLPPMPLVATPGLAQWHGQRFDRQLARCLRIWPGENDTGGFFIALLSKQSSVKQTASVATIALPAVDTAELRAALSTMAASALDFAPYRFIKSPQGHDIYLTAANQILPGALRLDAAGLRCYKQSSRNIATDVCHLLPVHQRYVILASAQVKDYVNRLPVCLSGAQVRMAVYDRRLVLVTHAGKGLGLGLLDREGDAYRLNSLFPKK
jgi:NOL1/NOP2/sun family putative RNA methylase